MFDFTSSVKAFAARSGSFDAIEKQIRQQSYDAAEPRSNMTWLRENGFLSETLIATENGWQPAGRIAQGDMVMTFDHGHQRVIDVQTTQIDPKVIPDRKAKLIHVPAGALGNRRDMRVLPMQELVVELDEAETLYGDPFVLIPAYLLDGFRGIRKAGFDKKVTVVMLGLEREEILHGDGGLLAISNTANELSPMGAVGETGRERYHRLSQIQLQRLISPGLKAARGAFAGASVEDTYAALESRLA